MAKARLRISPEVLEKLQTKHRVTRDDVKQCFENRDGGFLEDTREEHLTDPPTEWFIAETNSGRQLKVCFVRGESVEEGKYIDIKTAYDPNAEETEIYDRHGK